jgi:SNF2 family DNA or RNA helicase
LDVNEIKPGIVIEGPKWPEPIEIKKSEIIGQDIQIIGSMIQSGEHIDQILSFKELGNIILKTIKCDFSSESWKVFLALEAMRYKFASLYDPLLAMNTSKIEPLPHQIEAVYGYVLKFPRIRYLLAHDPGAGKTIMAGLIIKELKLRNLANRFLIVAPGHLKFQWQRELKEKFEENFSLVSRGTMNDNFGENVWLKEKQLITSIDFAKRDEVLPTLDSADFDMIIVDEAHKMAAYKYNEKISKTGRYKLGEILSKNSEHLLFLTATPHKGDTENFRLFLDLLQPGFFATTEMLEESIKKNENTLFLRRMKEDMKDFEGKPLFLPRNVITPAYRLSDSEKELYNQVTIYVKEQFNKALSSENKRHIGFALTILQRRLASSSYALWKSLQRRKNKLKDILENFEENKKKRKPIVFDFDEIEDMDDEERENQERIWETLSIAENKEELENEIHTLAILENQAKEVIESEVEVKLSKLKETMTELEKKAKNKKILIFTESKDTLEYLEKRIKKWGYSVNTIHGGMNLQERITAEQVFKQETQILVATEAAGEGINLQFCNLMINYDIPWNPNRLEQRMGRIHRYGQKYEVFVYNLVAADTVEGKIFRKLFEKLEEIRHAMNSDKVYDVIGVLLFDKNLAQLLSDAAVRARSEDEILKELDIVVDEKYINKVREDLGDTLATKNIDWTQLKDWQQRARENRLIPEYTAALFTKAFEKAGGKIRQRVNGLIAVDSIPFEIKSIADEDSFKKSFGSLIRSYSKMSFSKDLGPKDQDAVFISFGHPLFEAVLKWISKNFFSELQKGAIFNDPTGVLNGHILFYEGEIKDGTGKTAGKRLFSYFIDHNNSEIEVIQPSIMWDLQETIQTNSQSVDVDILKKTCTVETISSLRKYQNEILEERNRQADIKEKYGIKSLEKLIADLDEGLVKLRIREHKGEDVQLAIRNKKIRMQRYVQNKEKLEKIIQLEKNLTISSPKFIGIIQVNPPNIQSDEMKRDVDSEKIAMEIVMEYERSQNRTPVDVSKEIGPGFDIRSSDENGNVRLIEVKGRSLVGSVSLSYNEWFKAKDLGDDYYLYVVWNTANNPEKTPKIIQNPTNVLSPKENVHFIISQKEIEEKASQ